MKIKLTKDEAIETDECSIATLTQLQDRIAEEVMKMDVRIGDAKAGARQGEYADPDWFNRITHARKRMSFARQRLQEEIAKRKRAERVAESAQEQIPKYFIWIARDRLSPPVFDAIMREAATRFNQSQKGVEFNANYVFEIGE